MSDAKTAEEYEAEIERLRSRVTELEEWHREGGETTGEVALAYAAEKIAREKAEARLRAVVGGVFLAAQHGNVKPAVAENMAVLAGYERCGWCNGEGWIRDNERNEERPCDCIYGWRPRGDDDE